MVFPLLLRTSKWRLDLPFQSRTLTRPQEPLKYFHYKKNWVKTIGHVILESLNKYSEGIHDLESLAKQIWD